MIWICTHYILVACISASELLSKCFVLYFNTIVSIPEGHSSCLQWNDMLLNLLVKKERLTVNNEWLSKYNTAKKDKNNIFHTKTK